MAQLYGGLVGVTLAVGILTANPNITGVRYFAVFISMIIALALINYFVPPQ